MSIKNPYEVSLANVLPWALEEEKVMTLQATRHTTHPDLLAPAMMIGITSLEEQMATLARMLECLLQKMQQQEDSITHISRKIADQEHRARVDKVALKQEKTPVTSKMGDGTFHASLHNASSLSPGLTGNTVETPIIQVDGMVSAAQLKEFILGTIKSHEDWEAPSYTYVKPYTSRIDQLKMPKGYRPHKLQHFDETGNSKQHIAHFVKTCNNAGTEGDEMVKKFLCSLKGMFDWYTDLEPSAIDSWSQLESEFLNRFFSTKRRWHEPSTPTTPYSKAKYDPRKSKKTSKLEKKEEHAVTSKMTKFTFRTKKDDGGLDLGKKERLILKGMQEKEYPFLDSDIPMMFDNLLKAKLIELPESKRPEEASQSTEPNFCRYQKILGHPIEK
ncbi:hypothetical protein LIER_16461 [Lithospermum erythrorhizon]|uniref:Retrotransposon gag domain-containing protein n=1 Tax=Lithospermum erythrorhizon TaxID=34254 RepID=A0AAV3QAV5_LITER